MTETLGSGWERAQGVLRVLAVSLTGILPLAASCTVAKDPVPAVIGSWKAPVASIQFLEGGKLGEVSLLPAMCRGKKSPTAVKFTGTWKYGTLSDAGPGAVAQLVSVDGDLRCEGFFQYVKRQGEERLGLTDADDGGVPFAAFLRQ
ncbi:hypothetical protein [Kitasatospora sp. NBC_01300]|uniref:hypothetical protein n=1 Tax=Kitasatospora sp. NBC_01300 TaxID=2903574 RepID=UPI00352E9FE0|nr:hypothetical protein OG556_25635 [Kitasatospora sp. NBC_01300]